MFKFVTMLTLAVALSAAKVPLADEQRLKIAKLLSPEPDGDYGSSIELKLGDWYLFVNAKTGKVSSFISHRGVGRDEVINLKVIDQRLISHCNKAYKELKALRGILE